jgi:hypothetical protein
MTTTPVTLVADEREAVVVHVDDLDYRYRRAATSNVSYTVVPTRLSRRPSPEMLARYRQIAAAGYRGELPADDPDLLARRLRELDS